jgi:hypothetical protein
MNRRDQELLEKQLHGMADARQYDGIPALAILAVFCTGMAVGGFLYAYTSAYTSAPIQVAANEPAAAIALPHTAR